MNASKEALKRIKYYKNTAKIGGLWKWNVVSLLTAWIVFVVSIIICVCLGASGISTTIILNLQLVLASGELTPFAISLIVIMSVLLLWSLLNIVCIIKTNANKSKKSR